MRNRAVPNPIRRFKERRDLTWSAVAEQLGCSEDLAKKLGCEQMRSLSTGMALQFEERSAGEITFLDLMRWVRDRALAA